jgi:hypothetical protein
MYSKQVEGNCKPHFNQFKFDVNSNNTTTNIDEHLPHHTILIRAAHKGLYDLSAVSTFMNL